jgi:hypothetical protein
MKKHGCAGGSQLSRTVGVGSQPWAAAASLLLLCACSGSTDVVGVLPNEVETGALEGASSDGAGLEGVSGISSGESAPAGEYLFVAGLRLEDWDRPALEWPFANITLREFFADGSRPGPYGPPPFVERQVIAAMGASAKVEHVRFVAPAPQVIERLRDVFVEAEVDFDGGMAVNVMRDRRSDEYRVVLGPCGFSAGHHGGPCAEIPADGSEHP